MGVMDFLKESNFDKLPAVKLSKIGDKVTIKIVGTPRQVQVPNMNDRSKMDDKVIIDGELLVSCLVSEGKDTQTGQMKERAGVVGEKVALWIAKGQQAGAVAKAVGEAGRDNIEEGATLTLHLYGTKATQHPKPQNLWEAKYVPPVPNVAVSSLFSE